MLWNMFLEMYVWQIVSVFPHVEGCGVGMDVYILTSEAAPEGLQPPTVKAAGANLLEINWSPPKKPNGFITSYHIYR